MEKKILEFDLGLYGFSDHDAAKVFANEAFDKPRKVRWIPRSNRFKLAHGWNTYEVGYDNKQPPHRCIFRIESDPEGGE